MCIVETFEGENFCVKDFVYQGQQVVKPTLEKKCGLTSFRQEDSINYKKFLPEKIIAYWGMMGILPRYNTMKCQL